MSLSPAFLDELRARTSLSALVGKTVKIAKAGREYRGCCPFHNEKTPSFYVNDEKGFYHCFGCSAHGDAIRWMTDHRGLSFIDAVKELASSAGLDMPAPDPKAAERAVRADGLHDVMQAASDWFIAQLQGVEGADARRYLTGRGVNAATLESFGLGFAPDSRGKLRTALSRFGDDKLIEAGLLISVEDKEPYDRFRGRLMIPIRDARARVIAFGGRILGSGEPKYLNSPDTPLFDKGRTLYNLDKAAGEARKSGQIIVVEGYLDVIALAQTGIVPVVAPLGTALTEHQLERLWRMADVPVLCFDGDSAGQKAAMRAALRALPHLAPGRSLSLCVLPAGQDPDDLVKAGGRTAFDAILAKAEPLVEHLWRVELAAAPLTTPEERAGLRKRLHEHVATIGDADVRAHYAQDIRTRFDALFFPRRQDGPQRFAPRGKGGYREPPRPVSSRARSIGGGGINPVFARAILAGLIRHPTVILACAEAIASLSIGDSDLDRIKSLLVEAAFDGAPLDSEHIATICGREGLGAIVDGLINANGLAFSFVQRHSDADIARRDLGMAIEALAARPALDAALAAATSRLAEQWDEQGFADQQRLRVALGEADRKLAELAQGDDPLA